MSSSSSIWETRLKPGLWLGALRCFPWMSVSQAYLSVLLKAENPLTYASAVRLSVAKNPDALEEYLVESPVDAGRSCNALGGMTCESSKELLQTLASQHNQPDVSLIAVQQLVRRLSPGQAVELASVLSESPHFEVIKTIVQNALVTHGSWSPVFFDSMSRRLDDYGEPLSEMLCAHAERFLSLIDQQTLEVQAAMLLRLTQLRATSASRLAARFVRSSHPTVCLGALHHIKAQGLELPPAAELSQVFYHWDDPNIADLIVDLGLERQREWLLAQTSVDDASKLTKLVKTLDRCQQPDSKAMLLYILEKSGIDDVRELALRALIERDYALEQSLLLEVMRTAASDGLHRLVVLQAMKIYPEWDWVSALIDRPGDALDLERAIASLDWCIQQGADLNRGRKLLLSFLESSSGEVIIATIKFWCQYQRDNNPSGIELGPSQLDRLFKILDLSMQKSDPESWYWVERVLESCSAREDNLVADIAFSEAQPAGKREVAIRLLANSHSASSHWKDHLWNVWNLAKAPIPLKIAAIECLAAHWPNDAAHALIALLERRIDDIGSMREAIPIAFRVLGRSDLSKGRELCESVMYSILDDHGRYAMTKDLTIRAFREFVALKLTASQTERLFAKLKESSSLEFLYPYLAIYFSEYTLKVIQRRQAKQSLTHFESTFLFKYEEWKKRCDQYKDLSVEDLDKLCFQDAVSSDDNDNYLVFIARADAVKSQTHDAGHDPRRLLAWVTKRPVVFRESRKIRRRRLPAKLAELWSVGGFWICSQV